MHRLIATLFFILPLVGSAVALAAERQPRALPYQNGPANGWTAAISDYGYAPAFLIAVDKQGQQISLFERKSPLTRVAEYTCTTGQNEGDKLIEGDLKTPEGVYFVVKHIKSGLDYILYGHEAYTLNYPNPVDRLRKKTGYGIWIHGKGIPLVPFDSNGCVGMTNKDIATFRKKPMIGQPVTLAVGVNYSPVADRDKAAAATALAAKVQAWATAWGSRSTKMFDFYDTEAYSLAQGQSFSAFKAQKEKLFKTLPWINTTVSDIQVLEGPGYWVTWFNQDYKAPNLSSRGTRRLYWQQNEDGELRIVGMEWLTGLKSPALYTENTAAPVRSDATPEAMPESGTELKPNTTVLAARPEIKPEAVPPTSKLPEKVTPDGAPMAVKLAAAPLSEKVTPEGAAQEEAVQPSSTGQEQPRPVGNTTPVAQINPQAASGQAAPQVSESQLTAQVHEFIKNWQEAWEKQDAAAYAKFYSTEAIQGKRKGIQNILKQKTAMWSKSRITRLNFSNISIARFEQGLKIIMRQDYADSRGYADKGVKVLYLEHAAAAWQILREDWEPLVTK